MYLYIYIYIYIFMYKLLLGIFLYTYIPRSSSCGRFQSTASRISKRNWSWLWAPCLFPHGLLIATCHFYVAEMAALRTVSSLTVCLSLFAWTVPVSGSLRAIRTTIKTLTEIIAQFISGGPSVIKQRGGEKVIKPGPRGRMCVNLNSLVYLNQQQQQKRRKNSSRYLRGDVSGWLTSSEQIIL